MSETTYTVSNLKCQNCETTEISVEVEKGTQFSEVPCPTCGCLCLQRS